MSGGVNPDSVLITASCTLHPHRPLASNGISPLPSPEALQARKALISGDAAHGQAVKLKVSCTASPACAAAATAQQVAAGAVVDGGNSCERASSSVSNSSGSSDVCRAGSVSSVSSQVTSLATGSPAAPAAAGRAADAVCFDATSASGAQQLPPVRACHGCKPRKVSFHCPALHSADTAKATVPAGLQAAMAAAGMPPHSHKQQQRVSLPGPAHNSDDGSSSIEASGGAATVTCSSSKDAQEAALLQRLKLLPALSEPLLLDVTVGLSGSDCEDTESCCCDHPRRSSQSGTCSAAVAAASAGNRHAHSWRMTTGAHTGPAGPAASSTKCFAAAATNAAGNAACTSCPCTSDDGAAVPEPGNTGMLARSVPTGHKPRLLGSLSSASTGARRVVQLGGCSAAAAGAAATARAGCAGQSMQQQKPALLRFGSFPAAAVASGGSTKSLLCSPPKPAMLIQRLRSFARDRSCAASSTVAGPHRRHSVDLFPASAMQGAAAACAIGSSDPAAASDSPAECCCQSIPSSPQKARARPAAAAAAAAGLSSPLAALCKLGGFLSPPTASVAAAHMHNTCSTGPIQRQGRDPGVGKGAAGLSAQSGASSAEAGTAALLVGLAAQPTWAGQQHASSLSSPTSSCRGAKGVCLKVGCNTHRVHADWFGN